MSTGCCYVVESILSKKWNIDPKYHTHLRQYFEEIEQQFEP